MLAKLVTMVAMTREAKGAWTQGQDEQQRAERAGEHRDRWGRRHSNCSESKKEIIMQSAHINLPSLPRLTHQFIHLSSQRTQVPLDAISARRQALIQKIWKRRLEKTEALSRAPSTLLLRCSNRNEKRKRENGDA